MKRNYVIQDGLVMICGPTCSGKTTLAHKILDEAPYRDRTYISWDDTEDELRVQQGCQPEVSEVRYRIIRKLHEAFDQRQFVILEGIYAQSESIKAMTRIIFPALGLSRPITLLKVCPSVETRHDFFRQRMFDGFSIDDLKNFSDQGVSFRKFVLDSSHNHCADWIREYAVTDPQNAVFDFLPARMVTRELASAALLSERLNDMAGN